jgi:signal transduction histidine kinase
MRTAVSNAMQRRTLESEIHNNAEKLQDLLGELQNQKIEEQIANARGDIYASIIHDINGPLTVISGFIQIMNERISSTVKMSNDDQEFIKDRLKIITRQVTNCIEISRRYLSFLRQQTDDAPRVGVNQLFHDLEHLVQVHPAAQNHEFDIKNLTHDIGVKVNGTDLIQMLLNLTVNAFQCSTQSHRVTISGEILKQPLDLAKIKDNEHTRHLNVENFFNAAPLVKLSVADNGPGIPPEILPKIFQPYFTTKGPRQGTGLGLNIVQRLIKEAKGMLEVQTRVGQGTTFSIYVAGAKLIT